MNIGITNTHVRSEERRIMKERDSIPTRGALTRQDGQSAVGPVNFGLLDQKGGALIADKK